MAETAGIIDINSCVSRFMFKFRLPMEDGFVFTEHACDCWRDLRAKHSNEYTTEKVSIDSLGIIEMPSSMMTFSALGLYKDGELWTFTEKPNMVNTTTTVAEVETRSSTYDEDDAVVDGSTNVYGSRGGINSYYYTLDWDARRIFCDGITSDTAILKYTSSGISTTGTTYVPEIAVPVIDSYLMWKKGYWDGSTRGVMQDRERDYIRERDEFRNLQFSMTIDQLMDVIWAGTTQGPTR
jgi:hypothetical protein